MLLASPVILGYDATALSNSRLYDPILYLFLTVLTVTVVTVTVLTCTESNAPTAQHSDVYYERILVEIVVFKRRGWVNLSANFRGNGASLTNDC